MGIFDSVPLVVAAASGCLGQESSGLPRSANKAKWNVKWFVDQFVGREVVSNRRPFQDPDSQREMAHRGHPFLPGVTYLGGVASIWRQARSSLVASAIRKGHGEKNHVLSTKEKTITATNGYVEPMFHVKHPASLDLGMVGRPGWAVWYGELTRLLNADPS